MTLSKDILAQCAGKKIIVTGGTGMIGREVVNILCAAGAQVTSISLDKIIVHPKAKHVQGDLCDFNFVKEATKGADFVCHVAGIKGSIEVTKSKPASFFVPLLMMNTNVLEACRVNNVKRVVYTSSIGAYPSAEVFVESDGEEKEGPMDMFPGWAKRMAELQVKAYKIQYNLESFAVVRPCNVYGPGDNFDPDNAMVIPSLMSRIANGEKPVNIWGDGSAVRDFAYAADVAEGVILALLKGTRGTYVNLGSGTGVTIKELVETLQEFIPFEAHFDATKPSGFPRRVMDITRAREWLEYNPATTLRQGLEQTWNWFQGNREEFLQRHNYFKQA
ncbi:MAG TPA: NAD(P)-dependent oxidoreductase [Alphaproteobacteria bacterium]|nr:NAD(P)-dependent oxidoreductase [Alphaproteobacteria bacterium]